jgi:hypothetical protein
MCRGGESKLACKGLGFYATITGTTKKLNTDSDLEE